MDWRANRRICGRMLMRQLVRVKTLGLTLEILLELEGYSFVFDTTTMLQSRSDSPPSRSDRQVGVINRSVYIKGAQLGNSKIVTVFSTRNLLENDIRPHRQLSSL